MSGFIGFLFGLFVGANLAIIILAVLAMNRRNEK